ncbi:MAG: tetratricopeptide repeat protein [Spirochaetes bacterium]|nr:tetratricopeptide repeat protein [Spirochaetota bacterium]
MKGLNKSGLIGCISLMVLFSYGIVMSQFLELDIERIPQEESKTAKDEQKKERRLPVYVARNIKAERIPQIVGAIKITWEADPGFDDEFIVGRSLEVPHSMEKALNAKSIKVVPAGAEMSAIDSNLPPGNYYYVVLAKQKVQDRDVELFPNVNYTTVPVVIEQEKIEIPKVKYPEQVTLIHAMVINRNQVLITWKGIHQSGVVYNVYRGTEALNSPSKIKNADVIAQLPANKTSYIDTGIKKTGNYFYAVTTKDVEGNEDLQLVPDQSYTVNGVFVAMQAQYLVTNISAQIMTKKLVKISWKEKVPEQKGRYLIYRDNKPISTSEKLAMSELIGNTSMGRTEYIDENPREGENYYAVLGKLDDGTLDNVLIAKENYTVEPVIVGLQLQVESIRAEAKEGKVAVQWNVKGKGGEREYALARLENLVEKASDIKQGNIIAHIDINQKKFIDTPPPGKYYYALVPKEKLKWDVYELVEGSNITDEAVIVREDQKEKLPIFEEKKIEKTISKSEQKKFPRVDVDSVIRDTFFQGRYNAAIRKLDSLIKEGIDEKDAAKARLFIGRSYIEKGRYRKSLEYLLRSDVKEYYPDEAKFWSSFAISKLNGRR